VTYKKKLIEVALPLAIINAESAREKSIRQGHPSTMHLWWARRPLAAARAVLWSSLVDDPSSLPDEFPTEADQQIERRRLFDILERLVPWEASNDPRILAEARAEIERSCGGNLPQILDPFGGGGTIPLEALRLGLPTFTGDLNPVAVLIQRAMLQFPTRFAGRPPNHADARSAESVWEGTRGLAADLVAYGATMYHELARRTRSMYPDVILPDGSKATPIAWMWARTVRSPDPSWPGHVPLVGSWIVVKKPKKPIVWVEAEVDHVTKTISYHVRVGGEPKPGTIDGGKGVCLATGAAISNEYIKEQAAQGGLGTQMICVVADGARQRVYVDADPSLAPAVPRSDARGLVGDLPPAGQGLGFRVQAYGFTSWSSIFSARQMFALTTLSDLLPEIWKSIVADAPGDASDQRRFRDGGAGPAAYADAVVTLLAFAIHKCAARWNSLSIWHTGRETIEHVFRMQTVQMTWSFVEANPLTTLTGGWLGQVEWIAKAVRHLPTGREAEVVQRDARARVSEFEACVTSTDPPYYDNVGYADLSDFYYVWMKRNLAEIWPDECATLLTPKADELIADPGRAGSRTAAYDHFEKGMRTLFTTVKDHQDGAFPATVFYAFKATESSKNGQISTGWETFLQGMLDAGMTVTATWPLRTEMTGGVRNAGRNSLASSVVLACRPRHATAPLATRGEFVRALRIELEPAVRILQLENIAPVDLAQSSIGPGIAIFSRYARVLEADGSTMSVRSALGLVNEVLAEVLSGEESEFDPDTRFALTWFEQYGHNSGPFGDADLLARAKDTTVAGVAQAGVVLSRDGKVRLVERAELPAGWDPTADTRLTVWETTQHLIRSLESSETDAARLLTLLGGGLGDRARQLAYLLYGICERKKWADDAGAYNMLVTAWPEITRLARAGSASDVEDRLF
jgi:putative DNA methylase